VQRQIIKMGSMMVSDHAFKASMQAAPATQHSQAGRCVRHDLQLLLTSKFCLQLTL
jgi:hypothetical protein